jgi:diguanylate cyclase (GGDEF)-like protein/PAS domain S-box-containing protein
MFYGFLCSVPGEDQFNRKDLVPNSDGHANKMRVSLIRSLPWLWKISLLIVGGCLLMARLKYGLSSSIFALAMGGVLLALLSFDMERSRMGRWRSEQLDDAKFLAAAETSLDGFTLLDAVRNSNRKIVDFRVQYVNANVVTMTGRSREQLIGSSIQNSFSYVQREGLFQKLCAVVESGVSVMEEVPITRRSLSVWWLRYQAVKLGDGIAVTTSDITQLKTAQEGQARLAEFNNSIFQNAPFSMIATDKQGLIVAMNLAAEKMTGYLREELVGKASMTVLHDARELEAAAHEIATLNDESSEFEVLIAGTARGEMEEKEWTCIRRDGSKMPINLAMRAVKSGSGHVTGYVGIAFDITDRRKMLDHVTHLATHDQLTSLTGRTLLQDRTAQAVELARRYGTKVAVFMVDLDYFKRINDSLGHLAGDQILLETANRLLRAVRGSDTVARVGGDEFIVLMPDSTNLIDVEQCAANLVQKLAPEIIVDGQSVHVSASVGVCVYPDFALDARHLLKRADAAMYAAKRNGRNQYQIFTEDMQEETANRLTLEHALRHALNNGEMSLHYQPQISLATGSVIGMEALLRWNHPVLGNIEPTQFIPLAEETGLIVPIGEWAMMTACREGNALRDQLKSDLTVSVNLSPRQFQHKALPQAIERALAESGLPANRLEIEITENMLMINSPSTLETLEHIRGLGSRVAIDDFGTGFCSFSYLLQYQVDRLKIDQSFVRQVVDDANAAAVVRTIIAMSHGLNIKVIAEGVETEAQLRFLQRRRCDEAQGYFFAKPMPAKEFAAAVETLQESSTQLLGVSTMSQSK